MIGKKGNVGMYIGVVVALVLAVLLFVNLAFPQVRTLTDVQQGEQVLSLHTQGTNTTTTLLNTDVVLNSVTLSGVNTSGTPLMNLTSSNFSVNYTTAVVFINDSTQNGTYTANYNYLAAGYITNSGTRALAGVLILFLIVGLFAGVLKMFNVF